LGQFIAYLGLDDELHLPPDRLVFAAQVVHFALQGGHIVTRLVGALAEQLKNLGVAPANELGPAEVLLYQQRLLLRRNFVERKGELGFEFFDQRRHFPADQIPMPGCDGDVDALLQNAGHERPTAAQQFKDEKDGQETPGPTAEPAEKGRRL
jgi:hypothetical protein